MRILVLLPRFPYPLDKGDKLRAYHQIVELSKQHDIYLFALSHTRVHHDYYDHLNTFCDAVDFVQIHWWESVWGVLLAFLTGKPLQLGYWYSPRARRAYRRWEHQVQPHLVYCQMVRTIPTVIHSPYPKVLDYQDALSLNLRRRMERSHGPLRWLLSYEYHHLQRTEQQALSLFDAATVIAPADRHALHPSVIIVPNGVDIDYFTPAFKPQIPHNAPYSIVFTGNMSYAPNIDAATWLVKKILPLVSSKLPHPVKVLIAGADPKPVVKALAGPNVVVSGRLPDIRHAYASASIFVAPMRIGSGMQNKLLEAMAMGLPCVTTSIAASPLGATPWEHLLVGDTAEQIADLIVKLSNDELHRTIAHAGRRFVHQHYSWSAAVTKLENIFYAQLESK